MDEIACDMMQNVMIVVGREGQSSRKGEKKGGKEKGGGERTLPCCTECTRMLEKNEA